MKRQRALLLLVTVMLAFMLGSGVQSSRAQKRGPSTPEERAKAVQLTRALEADPLARDSKDARRWLVTWLTDVPDITVTICPDYLRPIFNQDKNYAPDLFFQMTFSSAAFIIEHPDQANDAVAVNLAGVEGTLKAYEAILKAKPKARWPFLDELIERRSKGTLEEYVREINTTKCKG
ncbi:MAG TPA: hypothetical protein VGX92_10390 [Pyrinomonadaceae bacterium]|jgi:hypothetical protein|nr:hypothetical protein [Pyrinomonadaceae bacterium]